MAYQATAFQNLPTHGIKGFQVVTPPPPGGAHRFRFRRNGRRIIAWLCVGLAALLTWGGR